MPHNSVTKPLLFLPAILVGLLAMAFLGPGVREIHGSDGKVDLGRIYGRIQFVNSFPDFKVQVVNSFPDLKVQMVDSFPDKSGLWQKVDSFPDYKVQIVDSFPDFTIQWVKSFPGPAN